MTQRVNRANLLVEQPASLDGGPRKMSRRSLLRLGGAAFGGIIASEALRRLDGVEVALNRYPIFLDSKDIGDFEVLGESVFGAREGVFAKSSEGRLLSDPHGNFFAPESKVGYFHRINRPEDMDEAAAIAREEVAAGHKEAVPVRIALDIDVNVSGDGKIYGDHGIFFPFGVVVDVNEKRVAFGKKHTYEELIAYVVSLNERYPELELAVSIELKRGIFTRKILDEILDIHERYGVPLMASYDRFMEFYGNP